MQDNTIIDAVLIHLQGYIAEYPSAEEESDNQEEDVEDNEVIEALQNSQREETISDLQYDKKVQSTEVISFYNICTNYALSYMNRTELPTITKTVEDEEVTETDPVVTTAIEMWTAGKLWQKYDVRINNNEDDTNTLGYGDKLVIQAKEMLKPYKYYDLKVY